MIDIKKDLKEAMLGHDQKKANSLRLILSTFSYKEIEVKHSLTLDEQLKVLQSLKKKSEQAIELFKQGDRNDLVQKEQYDLNIIQKYLPIELDDNAIMSIVEKTIEDILEEDRVMGHIMKSVMLVIAGQADGKRVQQIVKDWMKGH